MVPLYQHFQSSLGRNREPALAEDGVARNGSLHDEAGKRHFGNIGIGALILEQVARGRRFGGNQRLFLALLIEHDTLNRQLRC